MSGEQINYCDIHQSEFVAIENGENEMEKRRLCLKCLANGHKRKVILIKDQIKNVQDIKSQFNSDRQKQIKGNLQYITELIEKISQLKDFYITQIKKIDELGEIWKQKIQIMGDSSIEQVNKQEENNQEQFLCFVNQLQNIQIQELSQNQIDIENQLLLLKEPEVLQDCIQIVKKVQFDTKIINIETQEKDQKLKLNIFCEEHKNQRVILFDLGKVDTQLKRLACLQCIDKKSSQNYQTVNFVHLKWNKIITKRQENMERNLRTLDLKVNSINKDIYSIQESIKQSFEQNHQKLDINYNQYKKDVEQSTCQMKIKWQQLSKEEILKIVEEISNTEEEQIYRDPLLQKYVNQEELVNQIIKENLLYLQACQLAQISKLNNPLLQNQIFDEITTLIQKTNSNLNNVFRTGVNSTQIQKEVQTKGQINNQNFTYKLMRESSVKEEQLCRAMAFNKDCSIVLVGCNDQIQVYEFRQERLKKNKDLKEHGGNVVALSFMKKSNQFISGSEGDGLIIIWSLNPNNEWLISEKLIEHSAGIRCLILNDNEDLIVSCDLDDTIFFWVKQQQQNQWILQQTINKQSVCALSINQQQNKLILCGQDDQILILEFQKSNKIWVAKQKVSKKGIRICFIEDNLFTIQTYQNEILEVYEMKNKSKFTKTKDVQVLRGQQEECPLFPQQYIKSKCLLVSKNCQYVNIIKIKENGEFITQQSIEFQSSKLYGCMSDDAQYLITWDNVSKEIQIRKHQEL
ncbi:unnamed protein product (macronuclear) [Paramecium tetraurelia]|uniref:Uncharacterized protein n=1 Tax=Paramecium tetraurelia TaxID=5888 RepID=A0BL99_PARTE|nr:uncharacterized protein GSPATT00029948001 [Paramecium tetraurelia]CAK59316.1 unnamed protein product [Paramecium tetraurelia]|eukprot:XP_001426714.1 hypothetical protein (macronuclear) [Paramecium tetraurelia strain d4-2]